jgi:hypothetical protein
MDETFRIVIPNPLLTVILSKAKNIFVSLRTGSVRNPVFSEKDCHVAPPLAPLIIIKGLIIELTFIRKSPRAPLFQRGDYSSLCQREVRRDFIKQCRHYYETVNISTGRAMTVLKESLNLGKYLYLNV